MDASDRGPGMVRRGRWLATAACILVPLALGGAAQGQDGTAPAPVGATLYTEAQAAQGWEVFIAQCAGCHGGETVVRFTRERTGRTFFDFISGNMPYEAAGSLPENQYIDLVAFFMRHVGFPAGDTELTAEALPSIVPATYSGVLGTGYPLRRLAYDEPFYTGPARTEAGATATTDNATAAGSDTAGADSGGAPATPTEITTPATPPADTGTAASAGGVFTAAQAMSGQQRFAIACGGCHSPSDLARSVGNFPTAWAVYQFISVAMPLDAPGSLQPQQYADIVAYLLRERGFPAGDAVLAPTQAAMEGIVPAGHGE